MPERLIDINGNIILEPEHYHEALKWGRTMIDKMEEDGIDRSDMCVIVDRLVTEMKFSLTMLKDRDE